MVQLKKIVKTILINVALTIILLLLLEGFSSIVLRASDTFFGNLVPERRHTQYDDELGWINLPNLYLKDMYGPGNSFKTNSMSFRSDREVTSGVPAGKVRVLCSGDSFTMGYGVDNDEVWCQLLESKDNTIESVNLGQGGYGIDQAYLWFKRNSPKLDFDVHVFAFITDDFNRMQSDTFNGFGKPFLALENGLITNKNRPVPTLAYKFPRLPRIREGIDQLSSVTLLKTLLLPAETSPQNTNQPDDSSRQLVLKLFDDVRETSSAKGSITVFVYLPKQSDYLHTESDPWRQFLHERSSQTSRDGFCLIDLVDEIRKLPPQEIEGLFNQEADFHYSEKGNQYVADVLFRKLLEIREIESKFQQKLDQASYLR